MRTRLIIILLLMQVSRALFASGPYLYMTPQFFGAQQGLSSPKIKNIVQDHLGYIWLSTEDGLNRFDGYYFEVYQKTEDDPNSLRNNYINSLLCDSRNRLWVGTIAGLQYYDRERDNFVTVNLGMPDELMNNNSFTWMMEDSHNNLWLSIHTQGVVKYSLDEGTAVFYQSLTDGGKLSSKSVRHIVEDHSGRMWFASFDNGITVYNPSTDTYNYYNTANGNFPTDAILRIVQLHNGNMLITTLGEGIFILDPQSGEVTKTNVNATAFSVQPLKDNTILIGTEGQGLLCADETGKHITYHPSAPQNINQVHSSKIQTLLEDKNGNLWLGGYDGGICFIKRGVEGLNVYKRDYNNPNSLSYGQIFGITKDKNGNIWFASDGGGLNFFDRNTGQYTHYKHDANDKYSLPDNAVVSVCCHSDGTIWAGTYLGGLCRFDAVTGKFRSYKHNPDNPNSLPDNYVKKIIEDSSGNLWIATDGTGLSYFNLKDNTFTNYSASHNPGLVGDNIISLFLQDDDHLWIGTYTGISRMNIKDQTFTSYNDRESISNLTIYSISKDETGNIWVGTSFGLYLYDPHEDNFRKYALSGQFNNLVIGGIIPYKSLLWLSTGKGIVCYDPRTSVIKEFISNNDLETVTLKYGSYYIGPDNEIFFGGGNECYSFYPDDFGKNKQPSSTYIRGFDIFNEPIHTGKYYRGRQILEKSLEFTRTITLKHSENSFTLRLSSPTILYAGSMSYYYRMEQVDKQWVTISPAQQSVTYANLSPGTYTFSVYVNNIPDPQTSNITQLTFVVLPPWWMTWWAKVIYVLLALTLVYFAFRIIYIRMQEKNELVLEKLRARKQEELNQSKMQFFTNISHEFRTPLTLIISPLEKMKETEPDRDRAHLMEIMLRNANRLLRLINQILDLRKAENNKIQVKARSIELITFLQDFIGLFGEIVREKNIRLTLEHNTENAPIWYDPDLLEKCLYNLLFNSIKYTPEGGEIAIRVEKNEDGSLLLSVSDNGCGISKDELPYLFERFYQGDFSKKTGTGIGLNLVNTIVKLHYGEISVDSDTGRGSCFTISILSGKEHFNPEDVDETPWNADETDRKEKAAYIRQYKGIAADTAESTPAPVTGNKTQPLILLVEDENDMRTYIRQSLSSAYRIAEATNGREALEQLQTIEPDLIITDVMMPEMDGIEFTRTIKENLETCHIPVVLLTAHAETEHKLAGLETGADSYITKPFNMDYLLIRTGKLLEIRKKMRDKFSRLINLEAQEVTVTDTEDLLVKNCIDYIRNHIADPELSIEKLAAELNLSRTSLHRKIKTLTGNSPIELIKTIRMKQAAYLLENSKLSISDIAYEVGFSTPSYFSTSFTAFWGISPTAFIKEKRK